MKKKYGMKQCRLVRGDSSTISWLPDKFAVKGKIIDLRSRETGKWSKNWEVVSGWYSDSVNSDYILEREQDYKHQRAASDI